MWRSWATIGVTLLATFQFGIVLAILNTILEPLSEDLDFDETIGGAVATAALYIGAIIGGFVVVVYTKLTGKYSYMWTSVLFFLGSLLPALMTGHNICWGGPFDGCVPVLLFIGRVLMGLASGLTMVIAPKFLTEIAPVKIRGIIASSTQLSIAIGVFFGYALGLPYEFDSFNNGFHWWRAVFIISCCIAMLQFFLFLFALPSFSKPTMEVRQDLEAAIYKSERRISQKGQNSVLAIETHDLMGVPVEKTRSKAGVIPMCMQHIRVWWAILADRQYRRSIILGIGIPFACQISGVASIGAYSTTIFEDAGFNRAIIASAVLGFGDIVGSLFAVIVFDKVGRKPLAYFSYSGMAFSFLVIALGNMASDSVSGPVSVASMFIFIVSFGIGSGPLAACYAPEVVPTEISEWVIGTGQAFSFIASLISVLVFPSVLDAVGVTVSFMIMFAIAILCLLFCKVFMVETSGRELSEIAIELKSF